MSDDKIRVGSLVKMLNDLSKISLSHHDQNFKNNISPTQNFHHHHGTVPPRPSPSHRPSHDHHLYGHHKPSHPTHQYEYKPTLRPHFGPGPHGHGKCQCGL